ncbi:MAG: energy transducer TonB [Candidatus Acidiferrum sp.]
MVLPEEILATGIHRGVRLKTRINYLCVKLQKMLRFYANRRVALLAIIFSLFVCGSVPAQDKKDAPAPDAGYRGDVHALAGHILKRADKAKCHPNQCAILVENFTWPSGLTSRLGVQLADSVSAELRAQASGIQIVDRSRLRDYLEREHIPSNLLKDWKAARWLATEFQANAVLVGSIEQRDDHFDLLVELLNVSNEKIGSEEAVDISISDPRSSLAPFEPFEIQRSIATQVSTRGGTPARPGVNGNGVPECIYCPPPLYTNQGREAKINGSVVLQATVTEDGRAADIRVLKGMPFGMNEQAVKSVSGWKFKPATGEAGKPVSVLVPIEVTFRLY